MSASRLRPFLLSLAIACSTAPAAFAQSWTAPRTWTTGELVTASIMNQHIRDNLLVLRAGGLALSSQAAGDVICASSSTQLGRVAAVATGQVVISGGAATCPAYSATLPSAVQANITQLGTISSAGNVALLNASNIFSVSENRLTPSTATAYSAYSFLNTGGSTYVGADSSTASQFATGANYAAVLYTSSTGGISVWSTNGSAAIRFGAANAEKARIHSSGGFSIGNTTNPGAASLRVGAGGTTANSIIQLDGGDGSNIGAMFQFQRNGSVKASIGTESEIISGTSNNLVFYSNSDAVKVYTAGVLGLTIDTSQAAIHAGPIAIDGGTPSTHGIYMASATAASSTYTLENRSGNLYFNGVALATGSSVSGTTGKLSKFTGASTIGDSVVSESSGNLTHAGASFTSTLNSATEITHRVYNNAGGMYFGVSTGGTPFINLTDSSGVNRGSWITGSSGDASATFGGNIVVLDTATYSLTGTGANGVGISATHASGAIRLYTGSGTLRWTANSSGHLIPNGGATYNIGDSANTIKDIHVGGIEYTADGSAAFPSRTFEADADTGFYRGGGNDVRVALGGALAVQFGLSSSNPFLYVAAGAYGTGNKNGAYISVGYNTSGNGAAGTINLLSKAGANGFVWQDGSGNMRVHTAQPTEDGTTVSDTAGTVIGTQTSTLDTKLLIAPFADTRYALDVVSKAPLWSFRYKQGIGGTFVGVMSNTTPEVMMDPSPEHPEGRSFSPVSAFGYTAAAIAELRRELEELRNPYRRLFQIPK